jgi:hypothetical protein
MIGRAAQGVHVMGVGQGDRVACVATIDLSKTPAPAELKSASTIDDLALLPEPSSERPRRRRAAAPDAGNEASTVEPKTPKAKAPPAAKADKPGPAKPKNTKPDNGSGGRGRGKK